MEHASRWPDLIVAAIMAGIFVMSSMQILRRSIAELPSPEAAAARRACGAKSHRPERGLHHQSVVLSENSIRPGFASYGRIIASLGAMFAILHAAGILVADLFTSRGRLEAEILLLRHQLRIAMRRAPPRLRLRGSDRALLVWMTRVRPSLLDAVQVVQPETVLRWHRAGFKIFWRWKSRHRAGRPRIDRGLRDLIRQMSRENPLWGASRIHGELLMLGFEVAQSTVSKYMTRPSKPPSQTWKTFLRNHAEAVAAIDMCVVPTLTFDLLFVFLVLGHSRRQLLWLEVTRHPTAEWLARQITEAFPWTSAPAYLVRDNDRAYGRVFTSRVRAMGIRDLPISGILIPNQAGET